MTAKMQNNFINYSDFLDILIDAYETAPRELFEKMMQMIISTLHQQSVTLEKEALELGEMSMLPIDDLEEYYDSMLDEVEDIKLLKKRLIELRDKDTLFDKLYISMNNLHQAYISHIDRMGQLEIALLAKEQSA